MIQKLYSKDKCDILTGDVALVHFKHHTMGGHKVIRFNVGEDSLKLDVETPDATRTIQPTSAYDFRFWLWGFEIAIDHIDIYREVLSTKEVQAQVAAV